MELSKKIKQRREELGMSQGELANKLGYKSRSTINKIEMGINEIPITKISDFAKALDIAVDKLIDENELFKQWDVIFNSDVIKMEEKIAGWYKQHSPDVYNLLKMYYELNEDGRKEVLKVVDELGYIEKYQIERED